MTNVATASVVRQLGTLFEGGSVAGLSDRQLIERYIAGAGDPSGEAAFAALVGRHGPMVLGVCRQLLGDVQHAEDTFQAVFLVLARKARSIRDPDLLGNWLYGVAIRTARCARQQIARRRQREDGDAMNGPGASPFARPIRRPRRPTGRRSTASRPRPSTARSIACRRAFRLPVVLCYFEGLTLDEAARRLRCPAGTLRSRLARARRSSGSAWLGGASCCPPPRWAPSWRHGPPRRPFLPSCAIPPRGPRSPSRPVTPPPQWALSAPVAALAQEVLTTMLVHKLRLVVMTVLALAGLATGAGYLALTPATAGHEPRPTLAAGPLTVTARPDARAPRRAACSSSAACSHPTASRRPWRPVDIIGTSRMSLPDSETQADALRDPRPGHGRRRRPLPRRGRPRLIVPVHPHLCHRRLDRARHRVRLREAPDRCRATRRPRSTSSPSRSSGASWLT